MQRESTGTYVGETTMTYRNAIAAVAWLTTLVLMGVGAVHAQQSDTALVFWGTGPDIWHVHVGIDVYMSRQDAETILAGNPQPFEVTLWGADEWDHDRLFAVPIAPGWPVASEVGLSAEFGIDVGGDELDEDWPNPCNDLFAKITLWDPRVGPRTFFTPTIIECFGDSFP
jgi:hypothetical protein